MSDRERLHELHLALEGAVEQLSAAHRIASSGLDPRGPPGSHNDLGQRLDRVFADAVGLRNEVRDHLLNALGRPT